MSDSRITQAEMIEMFGEAMPIEAVNLLWNSPPEKTLGQIRGELRQIAASRPMPDTHPSSNPSSNVVERLRADIDRLNERPFDTVGAPYSMYDAAATIERLSAELERVKRGGEQGVAADALDFALGHCKPEEMLAFLEDWRFGRAVEWPGFVKWLARQRSVTASPEAVARPELERECTNCGATVASLPEAMVCHCVERPWRLKSADPTAE